MSPLEFDVLGETGHASAYYSITLGAGCPPIPNEPMANEEAFQESINAEFSQSLAEDLERFGWIYRDPNTLELAFRQDFGTHRDRCGVYGLPVAAPAVPGLVPLAGYHTHIIPIGQTVGIGACASVPAFAKPTNGPHDQDLDFIESTGLRHYIIDDDELHIVQPNRSSTSNPWTAENGCR